MILIPLQRKRDVKIIASASLLKWEECLLDGESHPYIFLMNYCFLLNLVK